MCRRRYNQCFPQRPETTESYYLLIKFDGTFIRYLALIDTYSTFKCIFSVGDHVDHILQQLGFRTPSMLLGWKLSPVVFSP